MILPGILLSSVFQSGVARVATFAPSSHKVISDLENSNCGDERLQRLRNVACSQQLLGSRSGDENQRAIGGSVRRIRGSALSFHSVRTSFFEQVLEMGMATYLDRHRCWQGRVALFVESLIGILLFSLFAIVGVEAVFGRLYLTRP